MNFQVSPIECMRTSYRVDTMDSFSTLQTMNNITRGSYKELSVFAQQLIQQDSSVTSRRSSIRDYLSEIDEVQVRITQLENVVLELDKYSKHLQHQQQQHKYIIIIQCYYCFKIFFRLA